MSDRPAGLQYYEISVQAMLLHLAQGNAFHVIDGVPSDAEVVDAGYDARRQIVRLTAQSEQFDPVYEGQEIPQGDVEFESLEVDDGE